MRVAMIDLKEEVLRELTPRLKERGISVYVPEGEKYRQKVMDAHKHRCDVVHIHVNGTHAVTGLGLVKLFKMRLVVSLYGGDRKLLLKAGGRKALKHADEIIVNNDGMQMYMDKKALFKTHYLTNGVDIPEHETTMDLRYIYDIMPEHYLLYAGSIEAAAGVEMVVQAFMNLDTEMKLVIAGPVDYDKEFAGRFKLLCEKDRRIVFAANPKPHILAQLYDNAYVFVSPANSENIPRQLLTAMSYGKCCMADEVTLGENHRNEAVGNYISDKTIDHVPGISEAVVMYRWGDTVDFTEKLGYMLTHNAERLEIGRAAVSFIEDRFNWEERVDKLEKWYTSGAPKL